MLQSTNHRLLLRPETPGHNLSPSALSLSNLPTLFPSFPSFSYLGKTKKNLFFAFFILFFFLLFATGIGIWGIPKARRVGKLQKVGFIPSQKADGSCSLLSRRSWGLRTPEWGGRVCPGVPFQGKGGDNCPGGPVEGGVRAGRPSSPLLCPEQGP